MRSIGLTDWYGKDIGRTGAGHSDGDETKEQGT